MSFSLGLEGRAALEAIDACDRLFARLAELVDGHEHAAAVARPDWMGPHRDAFEDRFDAVQYKLRSGEAWILQLRRVAAQVLQSAIAEMNERNAAVARAGSPR